MVPLESRDYVGKDPVSRRRFRLLPRGNSADDLSSHLEFGELAGQSPRHGIDPHHIRMLCRAQIAPIDLDNVEFVPAVESQGPELAVLACLAPWYYQALFLWR